MNKRHNWGWWIGWVMVWLMIFVSRITRLDQRELNYDEVWGVWQSSENLGRVFDWLPYDWTALHFVILWAWQKLMGFDPLIMRVSSVFIFMLGCAWMYRAAFALFKNRAAAWGTLFIYAALGYSLFLSVYVRAYVLLLALFPLALWLTLHYWHKPTLKRAFPLALTMAAMFYTNLTAVIAFACLGLVTLWLAPRHLWRWVVPGGIAFILALPEVIAKSQVATRRVGTSTTLPDLPIALLDLYRDFTGTPWLGWLIALGVVILAILWRERRISAHLALLLFWVLLAPIAMYALNPVLGFFSAQYSWWILIGLALLMGYGFAVLPRPTQHGAIGLALIALFAPLPIKHEGAFNLPFEATLRGVQGYFHAEDVFLRDPACACGSPMEWNYYQRVYFPHGMRFVTDPTGYARVWYISANGQEDAATLEAVQTGRIAGAFVGPWNFLFRVYEAPPNPTGIAFENGLRFHGAQFFNADGRRAYDPLVRREGETLRVRLWWSVDQPLTADYSVGIHIMRDERLFTQSDSAPQLIRLDPTDTHSQLPAETSRWQIGRYYVEERELVMPYPSVINDYMIYLLVYQWWDGLRLSTPASDEAGRLPLAPMAIMAW